MPCWCETGWERGREETIGEKEERIKERGKQRERDKETKGQIVVERTYESVMG